MIHSDQLGLSAIGSDSVRLGAIVPVTRLLLISTPSFSFRPIFATLAIFCKTCFPFWLDLPGPARIQRDYVRPWLPTAFFLLIPAPSATMPRRSFRAKVGPRAHFLSRSDSLGSGRIRCDPLGSRRASPKLSTGCPASRPRDEAEGREDGNLRQYFHCKMSKSLRPRYNPGYAKINHGRSPAACG